MGQVMQEMKTAVPVQRTEMDQHLSSLDSLSADWATMVDRLAALESRLGTIPPDIGKAVTDDPPAVAVVWRLNQIVGSHNRSLEEMRKSLDRIESIV